MTTTQMELLSAIAREYDQQGEPVTPVALATAMERDLDTVRDCFESFESKHLLKQEEEGYRPTVTARELLELDVDDCSLLILDTESEEYHT